MTRQLTIIVMGMPMEVLVVEQKQVCSQIHVNGSFPEVILEDVCCDCIVILPSNHLVILSFPVRSNLIIPTSAVLHRGDCAGDQLTSSLHNRL